MMHFCQIIKLTSKVTMNCGKAVYPFRFYTYIHIYILGASGIADSYFQIIVAGAGPPVGMKYLWALCEVEKYRGKARYRPAQSFIVRIRTHRYDQALQEGGREPSDVMSLRYADTSLPYLMDRPSLCYEEMLTRNTSKCACVLQEDFF